MGVEVVVGETGHLDVTGLALVLGVVLCASDNLRLLQLLQPLNYSSGSKLMRLRSYLPNTLSWDWFFLSKGCSGVVHGRIGCFDRAQADLVASTLVLIQVKSLVHHIVGQQLLKVFSFHD